MRRVLDDAVLRKEGRPLRQRAAGVGNAEYRGEGLGACERSLLAIDGDLYPRKVEFAFAALTREDLVQLGIADLHFAEIACRTVVVFGGRSFAGPRHFFRL